MKQTIEIEIPEGYKANYNPQTKTIELRPVNKPMSWGEFMENKELCGDIMKSFNDWGLLEFKHLLLIRNAWVGDWKPNWEDGKPKWCINFSYNNLSITNTIALSFLLSFPTKEMAEEFLNTFKNKLYAVKQFI